MIQGLLILKEEYSNTKNQIKYFIIIIMKMELFMLLKPKTHETT